MLPKHSVSRMLSLGALKTAHQGENEEELVLQILGHKALPGSEEKYRLLLSDGRYSTSRTVLHPEMNNLILEQKLEKYSVIRVKLVCNKVDEMMVLILLNIKILTPGTRVNGVFGNPIRIECDAEFRALENVCQKCNKNKSK